MVDRYASADFNEHAADYNAMLSSIDLSLSLGNFVTVDDKLQDLLVFISENLGSSSNSIKHEVEYDEQTGTWSTSGFLNKENDRRVQLEISVYDPDGEQIQLLEFSDTKDGKFNTFWIDKVDPGLYATVLNWQGVTSIKITHVQDPNSYDASYDDPHLSIASEKYETLKIFLQEFGGSQYTANSATFVEIEKDIEEAINNGNYRQVIAGTAQLHALAERYLPQRDRTTIIDASYDDGKVRITGAVEKLVQFSEDLYVDIYNSDGKVVLSVAIKDSPSGYVDETVSINLEQGLYVARIHYHTLTASDFFNTY